MLPKLLIFAFVLLTGCATYQISKQSLLEQFAHVQTEKKVTILVIAPPFVFFPGVVNGNDLTAIKCTDKNGKELLVNVTNRTGVRITTANNNKTSFYFNTLLLKDSTIVGSKTHFFNAQIKPIKFSDITQIEIMK